LPARDPRRELEEVDRVFAALANASRRQILLTLHLHGGRMTAGAVASRFACSWPTTTRHLRRLEDAGLVHVERSGRERFYELESATLRRVVGDWLAWFSSRVP
jgi:DNA-binding transcriptional ArsR family regulator